MVDRVLVDGEEKMKRRYAFEAYGVYLENLADLICYIYRVGQFSLRFFGHMHANQPGDHNYEINLADKGLNYC